MEKDIHQVRYAFWKNSFDDSVSRISGIVSNGEANNLESNQLHHDPFHRTGQNGTKVSVNRPTGPPPLNIEENSQTVHENVVNNQNVNGNTGSMAKIFTDHNSQKNVLESPSGVVSDGWICKIETETGESENQDPKESPNPCLNDDGLIIQNILEKLILNFHKATTTSCIFENSTAVWDSENELYKFVVKTKVHVQEEFAKKFRITPRVFELFESFAKAQYLKIRGINRLRKIQRKIIQSLLQERFATIERDLGYSWMRKLSCEIKAVYLEENPCETSLIKTFGPSWEHFYYNAKKERLEKMLMIITLFQDCEQEVLQRIETCICCEEENLSLCTLRAWDAGLAQIESWSGLVPIEEEKIRKIWDPLHQSLLQRNEERILGETRISKRAMQYAVAKYCEIMETKLNGPMSNETLKNYHSKIRNSIMDSYFNVQGFLYPRPWRRRREELIQRIKDEFDELFRRNRANVALAEAEMDSAVQNFVIAFRRDLIHLFSQENAAKTWCTWFTKFCDDAMDQLTQRFPAYQPLIAANFNTRVTQTLDKLSATDIALLNKTKLDSSKNRQQLTFRESMNICFRPRSPQPGSVAGTEAGTEADPRPAGLEQELEARIPTRVLCTYTAGHAATGCIPCPSSNSSLKPQSVSPGVGIFFTSKEIHVAFSTCNRIRAFAMSPYLRISSLHDPPILVQDTEPSVKGYQHLNIYNIVTKWHYNRTSCVFQFNGKEKRLIAEEVLALFFIKLFKDYGAQAGISSKSRRIAIGLPTSVSSMCRRRLKVALRFAKFRPPVFLQATTGIGLGYVQSNRCPSDSLHHHLAIYMQHGNIDVTLQRVDKRRFVSVTTGSATLTKKDSTEASIFAKLAATITSVLRNANVAPTDVTNCTCVIDEKGIWPKSGKGRNASHFVNWLKCKIKTIFPGDNIFVIEGVSGLMLKGLLSVSVNHQIQTAPSLDPHYREVFPFKIQIVGIKTLKKRGYIPIVSQDQEATDVVKAISISRLGTQEAPSIVRVLRRPLGRVCKEIKLFASEELLSNAPNAVIRISVDTAGLISTALILKCTAPKQTILPSDWSSERRRRPRLIWDLLSARKIIKKILEATLAWVTSRPNLG